MRNDLYHHGIKGQKWGVRNGPPYPLDEGKKSRAEKRMESHGPKGRHFSNSIGGNSDVDWKDVAKRTAKGVAITTAATAAATLAFTLALRGYFKHRISQERKTNLLEHSKDVIKKITGEHTDTQDMRSVNDLKGFMFGDPPGHRMNCTMCTTAYDLRKRGYDVQANTSNFGRTEKDVASWYKNTTRKDFVKKRQLSALKEALNEQPEGARGNIITGVGPYDSKHSMVWEKYMGQIVITDCQSQTMYDNIDQILRPKSIHGYQFLRTDNREINWDTVHDAISPHKKG